MGRWAQAKKRGSSGPLPGTFAMPPPTDEDWHLRVDDPNEVFAQNDILPSPAVGWEAEYTVGDSGAPALPWLPDSQAGDASDLDIGAFGSFRIWVHVRWLDGDLNPLSDWSTPQFIDVA